TPKYFSLRSTAWRHDRDVLCRASLNRSSKSLIERSLMVRSLTNISQATKSAEIAILRDPGTPAVGAADADVILVEYFDCNCPFCKKLAPALQGLLKADARVSLVYKDWPILGDVSAYAARSALAAGYQGKYLLAHDT